MSITRERFEMALSRVTHADWNRFERLASAFLASEYPSLRTMAAASGDGGRDSELFTDDGEPTTAMQYSVTTKWSEKINQTAFRLNSTFPNISTLVYVTNQDIGASADAIRKTFRGLGKFLDIRDRSWFLDRANTDRNREEAAESLAHALVDPLLSSSVINSRFVAGLDTEEAKVALLFLEMQVQDTNRSLGLTKASYDTLTLAALRDTNTARRMTREAIYARVQGFLPTHSPDQIRMKVDASLRRLAQKSIRHRKDADEYHLLEDEIKRAASSVARLDALRREFESDLLSVLATAKDVVVTDERKFVDAARRVLEEYFFLKGDDFAQAAIQSTPHKINDTQLKDIALGISRKNIGILGRPPLEVLLSVIQILISTPSPATSSYLRLLLESYTLFAFMAATPDVQKATRSMFGSGVIWLDTSVLLPVLAETTMAEGQRPFTEMFKQCRRAGLQLNVSMGVLEEIERHINKCKSYISLPQWEGPVPFLFSEFAIAGGLKSRFRGWIEEFVGPYDPIEDISSYLRHKHDISLEDPKAHDDVSPELADEIRRIWQDVHVHRRGTADTQLSLRLAEHDIEVYLHILSSRINQHGRAPLGYSDWWLTLDSMARRIIDKVDTALRPAINIGPTLSIDYLIRYLAFGPRRDRVDVTGADLAKIYADVIIEPIPDELMNLVTELREQHADLSENVVQRRIRDTLNHERSRLGILDGGGLVKPSDLLDFAY